MPGECTEQPGFYSTGCGSWNNDFPSFQRGKLRSQGDSHCYNCLLGHLLPRYFPQGHRSVLEGISTLLNTHHAEGYQKQMGATACRRDVTKQTYVPSITKFPWHQLFNDFPLKPSHVWHAQGCWAQLPIC